MTEAVSTIILLLRLEGLVARDAEQALGLVLAVVILLSCTNHSAQQETQTEICGGP